MVVHGEGQEGCRSMVGQAETNLEFGNHASLACQLALGNSLATDLPKLLDPRWCPFEVPLAQAGLVLQGHGHQETGNLAL